MNFAKLILGKYLKWILAAVFCANLISLHAAPYPERPITIMVPYSAGGLSDTLARDVGFHAGALLGQSVIVSNKPGGAAQIAMNDIKNNPADGYTLFVGDLAALALNKGLYSKLSYDPEKDLAPITQLVDAPLLLVVNPNGPYKTFEDLLDAVKKSDRPLSYASQGVGTGGHLFGALLSEKAGKSMTHVPYRGAPEGLQAVMAGEVTFMYDVIMTTGPLVKSGKLRVLAVGSKERSALFPDVPTLAELGYGDIGPSFWWGVVGKAGTPQPIIDLLHDKFAAAIQGPELSKKYRELGLSVVTSQPSDFYAYIKSQIELWVPIMRRAGMQVD